MRHRPPLAALALLPLALTACGTSHDTATATPSSAIHSDGHYANASELRAAYIEAGGDCPGTGSGNDGGGAKGVTAVQCKAGTRMMVYDDPNQSGKALRMLSEVKNNKLAGDNWLILSQDLESLNKAKARLGGVLQTY